MNMEERLILRLTDNGVAPNADIVRDCIETAKNAILSRRFPFREWTTEDDFATATVEPRYLDLQFRIALDLYNRIGVEGEISHSENGITRHYDASWISTQLLDEVVPYCGVVK